MRIEAVILAGGEGARMGGDKPSRRLGQGTLLDHVLARAFFWNLPCVLAVRDAEQGMIAPDLPLLLDEGGEGPIAGVAAALRHAERESLDAVLTLPCDTPLLPVDLLGRLRDPVGTGALAAVASSGGRLHPSCALWSVKAATALDDYLIEGRSLKGFAARLDACIVEWPVVPYDPFFNVNSETDLAEAERLLRT